MRPSLISLGVDLSELSSVFGYAYCRVLRGKEMVGVDCLVGFFWRILWIRERAGMTVQMVVGTW
jgi:hypothetical protein